MIYREFCDKTISMLGFGAMRLPQTNGEIDKALFSEMVDVAIKNGVNYFDTAWPYHNGKSELVVGEVLSRYPRDSYYLATKYPGHQISERYNPEEVFCKQLKKCGVEYFDFYLLHNVYENSIDTYLNPKWGIVDYFKEQKRLGKIKHLGFSAHGGIATLTRFLDAVGDDMEFCQIQLNWLDWTLQNAKEKVALLNERNIPIWVMEPVRGGKLCKLNQREELTLWSMRPDESVPAWGFRFLQDIPGVTVILSGMSDMAQMKDNVKTFRKENPLLETEKETLLSIAETLKDSVPCTGCRYCMSECPLGLNISEFMEIYNEIRIAPVTNTAMRLDALPKEKLPQACLSCGKCAKMCPQGIDIPRALKEMTKILEDIPKWSDICKQREEAAKAL